MENRQEHHSKTNVDHLGQHFVFLVPIDLDTNWLLSLFFLSYEAKTKTSFLRKLL